MHNYYGTMLVIQFPLLAVFPNRCSYLLEQIGVFWVFFFKEKSKLRMVILFTTKFRNPGPTVYFTKPPYKNAGLWFGFKDITYLSWHLFLFQQISWLCGFVIKSIFNVFNINKMLFFIMPLLWFYFSSLISELNYLQNTKQREITTRGYICISKYICTLSILFCL